MVYRAIGLMSGSSLDGLDIAYVEFHENGGKWSYDIISADCYPYSPDWSRRLREAPSLNAVDYLLLHTAYGHYLGEQVNRFIEANGLQFRIALVASHGHTSFHLPGSRMTAQLGDGAAIAAVTQLPVVADLRSLDLALGGQGAPIVPIGERLLLSQYDYFLNIGGIANISRNADAYIAFDTCPANRVLNLLAGQVGQEYDEGGSLAASGKMDTNLLQELDALPYYHQPWPKSLANDFGTDIVYPIIQRAGNDTRDSLRTYSEHIIRQIDSAVKQVEERYPRSQEDRPGQMLLTGGGAFNHFLVEGLRARLKEYSIDVVVPDDKIVKYKEAMIMALIGVLRWREETNVLSSVTGASRDCVGGGMWLG